MKNILSSTFDLSEKIGIWKPFWNDGNCYYERDMANQEEFYLWAKNHRIAPKGKNNRILLLGESVARGYFYDPFITPAIILEDLLNSNLGEKNVEVIDLARSNIEIPLLTKLTTSCLKLEPDAIVIFAGNNWKSALTNSLTLIDYEEIAEELINLKDSESIKKRLENKFKAAITPFINHIKELSEIHNVPFVFVIPEYNLIDWKSSNLEGITSSPGLDFGEWMQLIEQTEKYISTNDIKLAMSHASELIKMNGFNPIGYELLAKCNLKEGLWDEARYNLSLARDTALFRTAHKPRIFSIIRETLIKELCNRKIQVVDLASEFKEHLMGELPGRKIFLDYCHLSFEGLSIAMKTVAQRLCSVFLNKNFNYSNWMEGKVKPSDTVAANAHFSAAIHNAHYGQDQGIIFYHCLQAITLNPGIANSMIHYAAMASRNSPWLISKSLEKLEDYRSLEQYDNWAGLVQPENYAIMDIQLTDAIVEALKTKAIDIEKKIENLRKKEHGAMHGKVNLLKSYYSVTSYEKLKYSVEEEDKYFFEAYNHISTFYLIATKQYPLVINLTCRIPSYSGINIKIKINGQLFSKLDGSQKWKSYFLEIPSTALNEGVNILKIEWPGINYLEKRNFLKSENYDPASLILNLLYPLYGQIHMLNAAQNSL